FFLLLLAASRANRSARKRAVFSRVACSCAWYSAIACWASRNCCSFLNSVSARRRASSVFTLTIGTPCKALQDSWPFDLPPGLAADQKDILASNFCLAGKLGHASSE